MFSLRSKAMHSAMLHCSSRANAWRQHPLHNMRMPNTCTQPQLQRHRGALEPGQWNTERLPSCCSVTRGKKANPDEAKPRRKAEMQAKE